MEREPLRPEKPRAIAQAAGRLFSRSGYLETSMSDIVAACEVSKGAIYHYFSGKEDLLFAVVDGYMDLVLEGLEEEVHRAGVAEAQIRTIIDRHVALYSTHLAEARVLLRDARNLPPEKFAIIAGKQRRYYRLVLEVLSRYLGPELDPKMLPPATFTLFGMLNWVYSWYDPAKDVQPKQLSELIFQIFTTGLSGLSPSVHPSTGARAGP
jgi:AcrR family transcriptional regulator